MRSTKKRSIGQSTTIGGCTSLCTCSPTNVCSASKTLEQEDEHDTSKRCRGSGQLQEMPLYKRTYRCSNPNCLLVLDRDENSARNILQRYLARLGPHIQFDWMRCAAGDQCGVAVIGAAQADLAQQ
jgi:putative transposase